MAGWFFWNFRTEYEPHWDFLEAWRRGWFPRNVSDVAALEKLNVCDKSSPPLSPTAKHELTHGGIYGGFVEEPWLSKNWLPLVTGAVGGAVIALIATHFIGRASSTQPKESTPYTAM